MKSKNIKKTLAVFVFLITLSIFNFSLIYSAGTTALDFLNIGVGARPVGMGEAFTALSDDANAVFWNPAGLGQLKRNEVSFMYNRWFEDINYSYLSYIKPEKIGTFGASLYYVEYGEIKGYNSDGTSRDELQPLDILLVLSYGKHLKNNLSGGLNFKFIHEDLDEKSASICALDIGCLYNINPLNFAVVVQNLGPKIKFDKVGEPLPLNLKFGSAIKLLNENLNIALDATISSGDKAFINIGGEYSILNLISFRLGFWTRDDLDKGLRYGLGIGDRKLRFDYAFVPYGDLGATHRFSLSFRFGKEYAYNMIENDIERQFREAKSYFYQGHLLKAYRILNEVLALVPFHEGASDYIARARVRIEEGMISKEIDKHLLSGREYFKSGEVIKARSEFDIVLDFDPDNLQAKNYLQRIDKRLKEVVNSLFTQGMEYYNKGDYNIALNEMKKVLSFDPEHIKAKKYLLSVRKKLKEIEKIKKVQKAREHFKKGLLFYREKKFAQALGQLKKAQILNFEPEHVNNMIIKTQNEIEKLKKEKEEKAAEAERKKAMRTAENCYEQGVNFHNADKFNEAIKKFEEALKYNPLHKEAMEYLDKTGMAIKQEREAREKENRIKAEEYNRRGLIEYNNGNIREAIRAWEKALQLDPSHEEVRVNLERVRKEIKD